MERLTTALAADPANAGRSPAELRSLALAELDVLALEAVRLLRAAARAIEEGRPGGGDAAA